jgi:hypothetical protein
MLRDYTNKIVVSIKSNGEKLTWPIMWAWEGELWALRLKKWREFVYFFVLNLNTWVCIRHMVEEKCNVVATVVWKDLHCTNPASMISIRSNNLRLL